MVVARAVVGNDILSRRIESRGSATSSSPRPAPQGATSAAVGRGSRRLVKGNCLITQEGRSRKTSEHPHARRSGRCDYGGNWNLGYLLRRSLGLDPPPPEDRRRTTEWAPKLRQLLAAHPRLFLLFLFSPSSMAIPAGSTAPCSSRRRRGGVPARSPGSARRASSAPFVPSMSEAGRRNHANTGGRGRSDGGTGAISGLRVRTPAASVHLTLHGQLDRGRARRRGGRVRPSEVGY
jgi:hypothetical protein